MDFGIITLSVIPVRAEPNDRAEMVNQLLFGELIVITERYKNWHKIRGIFDNYEGWIDNKQYTIIDETEFNRLNNAEDNFAFDLINVIHLKNSTVNVPVLAGSSLPGIEDKQFKINKQEFIFEGSLSNKACSKESLVETALLYLNAPYLWGGRTPFGIDCSGLMQMIFKMNGFSLSRDASEQARQGETLNLMTEAKIGDLIFFDNEEGEIIHVGMLISEDKIIHASGKVRIDSIDHQGIYNAEINKYTHKLRLIKALI